MLHVVHAARAVTVREFYSHVTQGMTQLYQTPRKYAASSFTDMTSLHWSQLKTPCCVGLVSPRGSLSGPATYRSGPNVSRETDRGAADFSAELPQGFDRTRAWTAVQKNHPISLVERPLATRLDRPVRMFHVKHTAENAGSPAETAGR